MVFFAIYRCNKLITAIVRGETNFSYFILKDGRLVRLKKKHFYHPHSEQPSECVSGAGRTIYADPKQWFDRSLNFV
jgi:hypothetical protein